MTVSIPADWKDVTPRWMTKAIASHHPESVVGDVKIVTNDDGTNRRARFELSYAVGDGPKRVFLKAHSAKHRWVHLRNGNLWIEPSLFKSGADLPVDHPLVYLSIIDTMKLDFLLVMEDLAERGADMRDSTRPLSVDQVANALREGLESEGYAVAVASTGEDAFFRVSTETFDVVGQRKPRADLTLVIHRGNGETVEVPVTCRLDSDEEVSIYEAGGVLQRFAQDFLESSKAA